jgi:TspO/MBR family
MDFWLQAEEEINKRDNTSAPPQIGWSSNGLRTGMDRHTGTGRVVGRLCVGKRRQRRLGTRPDPVAIRCEHRPAHAVEPLFFTFKRPDWALAEIPFLWLSIVVLMFAVGRYSSLAVWLLLPYLLWVTLAAFLNIKIVRLNRPFGERA